MRRLLCALVALCLAMPAEAGKVLLIKQANASSNSSVTSAAKQLALTESVLRTLGVDYDVVPQYYVASGGGQPASNISQLAIRTGLVSANVTGSVQTQYAGIIHMGFGAAASGITRVAGYSPDTLTLTRSSGGVSVTWPSVPQLFLGLPNVASGSQYNSSSICSTGVHAGWPTGSGVDGPTGFPTFANGTVLSMNLVGQPEVWQQGVAHAYYSNVGHIGKEYGLSTTVSGAHFTGLTIGLTHVGDSTVTIDSPGTGGAGITENVTVNGDSYSMRVTNSATATLVQSGVHIYHSTPGITKSRVTIGANSASFRDNGNSSCADCDSMMRSPNYFDVKADTAILWTRQRDINDLSGMEIFALTADQGGPGSADNGMVITAMAIAIMDSATGGQIIGQKPGWVPPKIGFMVSGAFSHSKSDVNSSSAWNVHGVYYPSDTSNVKAGIDSLASLNIPIVVTVNVDSVASYPAEKAWWSQRLPLARFSPESKVYTDSLNVNGGETNSSRYLFPDVWGIYRSRQLLTANRYQYGTACGDADTTLSCQLGFMRGVLDSIPEFRGRMSSTLLAPFFDYIPRNYTRDRMPDPDSFAVACVRSGYNTLVCGTMFPYSTPSSSWGLNASGGNNGQNTFSPGDWYPNPRTQTIKTSSGQTIGQLKWLNMRHVDEDPAAINYSIHNVAFETMTGLFMSPWYLTDLSYWNHVMRSKLDVVLIKPGELGWKKNATSNVTRPGYFEVKWIVNQVRAINKLAGRTVIGFAYPEDIDPTW
jgi:hypothetical protein